MCCISSTIQYSWGFAACCKARWKQYSVDFHKWHVTVRLIDDAVLMYVKFKTNIKAARHLNAGFQIHDSSGNEPQLPSPALLHLRNQGWRHPESGRPSLEPPRTEDGDVFLDGSLGTFLPSNYCDGSWMVKYRYLLLLINAEENS